MNIIIILFLLNKIITQLSFINYKIICPIYENRYNLNKYKINEKNI